MKAFMNKQSAINYGKSVSINIPDLSVLVFYCPKSKFYYVDWKSLRLKSYEELIIKFYNGKQI